MNHVKDQLPALVEAELRAAIQEHGQFHSAHEGYAVLLEEVQEAKYELERAERFMESIWSSVRKDETDRVCAWAGYVADVAIKLAEEAIQVAAMARKMQMIQE